MKRRPDKRHQKPAGRVLPPREGDDTGEAKKSLQAGLAEVSRMEQARAKDRQKQTGIKQPLKHGFKPSKDEALEAALTKLWYAGPYAKQLYIELGKGLAALERSNVLALGAMTPEEIEVWAKMEILNSRFLPDDPDCQN